MAGLHFEQFEIGRVFEHEIRWTVTEADTVRFCAATFGTTVANPGMTDVEFPEPVLRAN